MIMETTKKENRYDTIDFQRMRLWVSAIAMLMVCACITVMGDSRPLYTVVLFLALAAISVNLWPYIGMQKPLKDERAARAGAKAGLAAWYVSLLATVAMAVVLAWLPESFDVHLTLVQGLGIVAAIMVVSMVGLYEYMVRKSDTEAT
jgi:hypothetical protein